MEHFWDNFLDFSITHTLSVLIKSASVQKTNVLFYAQVEKTNVFVCHKSVKKTNVFATHNW